MSTLKVDKLDPSSGTALEIGSASDTITVPSGATLDISSATLTPPATMPASSAANLTSIPAANVTGVLPVGVTGGSGLSALNATNLTSGAVPAARMPAGSVIQTVSNYGDTKTAGASAWTNTVVTANITPNFTDSDIIIHGYWFWDIQDASSDSGLAFRWKRTISSVDSYPDSIEVNTDQGHSSEYWASPAGGGGRAANVGATVIDTNTGSTSAHTYTLQHRHYNVSGTIWVGGNRWDNVRWSVVLQEIKG
jgi:hypothetical protein